MRASEGKISKPLLILGGIILLIIVIALASGGEEKGTVEKRVTKVLNVYNVGEYIELPNLRWRITEVKMMDGKEISNYLKPPGERRIMCPSPENYREGKWAAVIGTLELENLGGETIIPPTIGPGVKCDPLCLIESKKILHTAMEDYCLKDSYQSPRKLKPGSGAKEIFVFLVTPGIDEVQLRMSDYLLTNSKDVFVELGF